MEDDAPRDGARALVNADVFDPCWIYEQADLDGMARSRSGSGSCPSTSSSGATPSRSSPGRRRCQAARSKCAWTVARARWLPQLPLAPARRSDALTTLEAALPDAGRAPRPVLHLRLRGPRPDMDDRRGRAAALSGLIRRHQWHMPRGRRGVTIDRSQGTHMLKPLFFLALCGPGCGGSGRRHSRCPSPPSSISTPIPRHPTGGRGQETGDAAAQKLLKLIERDPRAKAEHAQLAHLAMEGGRTDLGKRSLHTRPFPHHQYRRAVARGDVELRLGSLSRRRRRRGGRPMAAALQARRSNAASGCRRRWHWRCGPPVVRTKRCSGMQRPCAPNRNCGAIPPAYARLLPDWRDAERATLAEVQAAWAANPPAWP